MVLLLIAFVRRVTFTDSNCWRRNIGNISFDSSVPNPRQKLDCKLAANPMFYSLAVSGILLEKQFHK